MQKNLVSRAEFARMMGTSRSAISQAVSAGRIETIKTRGVIMIDANTQGPAYKARSKHMDAKVDPDIAEINAEIPGNNEAAKARLMQEKYKALDTRLKYEKAADLVIEVSTVDHAWQSIGFLIQETVKNMSNRITPLVAEESDPHTISEIIENETQQILQDLADAIEHGETGAFGKKPSEID